MFEQRFRTPEGHITVIRWWTDGRIGLSLCDVGGVAQADLTPSVREWAYRAVQSRMGEVGEHKDEP